MVKTQFIVIFSSSIFCCLLLKNIDCRRFGIVGGEEGNIEDFPYQAAFLYNEKQRCGASIISNTIAITAAHCTDAFNSKVTLRVGSNNKYSGGVVLNVTKIVQHPNYDPITVEHDISLLLFDRIEFTDKINAVPLPELNEIPADGTECLISGWGHIEEDTTKDTVNLRMTKVKIINRDICSKNYNIEVQFEIKPKVICAGVEEGGKDSCQGDSGGPLVCNGKLYGAISVGYGCARAGFPGIYTSVSCYADWIKSESNKLNQNSTL